MKYNDLVEAISDLMYEESLSLVERYLREGSPAEEILVDGLSKGLMIVGKRFENSEYFLSHLIFAADIMNKCTKLLEPKLLEMSDKIPTIGKAVIGTVSGDIHDIGKNLFITLMKASGFEVIDLGVDIDAQAFIEAIVTHKPDILGMSALLSTTSLEFKNVIKAIEDAGLREGLYLMIGGPPNITAEEAGADIHCNDAFKGVEAALEHMKKFTH